MASRDRLTYAGDWHGLSLIPAINTLAIFCEKQVGDPSGLLIWKEPVVGWLLIERQHGGDDDLGKPTGYTISYSTEIWGVSLVWSVGIARPAAEAAEPCEDRHGGEAGCHLGYLPSDAELNVKEWSTQARRHLDICHRRRRQREN
jgi:hypothetical protein